jgi:septum formation protein
LGIPYELLAVEVEEIVAATPRGMVEENATRKLLEGLRRVDKGAIVIAADTVLETQGRILGKPADEAMARQYLQALSGGKAIAYSAVAVAQKRGHSPFSRGDSCVRPDSGEKGECPLFCEGVLATETAAVRFKVLSPEVIRWYLSTGEPMGRAGAFGIGQIGEVLTESVDGGYSCVSGLPKTALLLALTPVANANVGCAVHTNSKDGQSGGVHGTPYIGGTRVQLRVLALPVGHEVDHRHDDQREQR